MNMGLNKLLSQSTHMVLFQPGFCSQFSIQKHVTAHILRHAALCSLTYFVCICIVHDTPWIALCTTLLCNTHGQQLHLGRAVSAPTRWKAVTDAPHLMVSIHASVVHCRQQIRNANGIAENVSQHTHTRTHTQPLSQTQQ